MLIKGFAVVAGQKRLFLLGVLLVAANLGILAERSPWNLWLGLFAVTFTLILLMFALSLLAAVRYHPAVLFVRPEMPAFATAVNLAPVFSAAAFILLAGVQAAENVGDIVDGEELWVYYERPELVRQRGMRPAVHSLATGTDAAYLAAAIHQYVACPEYRSAIGSDTELRRLTAHLAG